MKLLRQMLTNPRQTGAIANTSPKLSPLIADMANLDQKNCVVELGAGEILLTSMDEDGQLSGYDLALTRAISESVPVPVIASGGAGALEHLYEALEQGKADAVLAASIFHFGTFTIDQAKQYLKSKGVPVRPKL